MFDAIATRLSGTGDLLAERSIDSPTLGALRREARQRAVAYLRETVDTAYGVHPLGFLSIPLFASPTQRIRLHLWHPALFGASSPFQIHDHSYASFSVILAGTLRNQVFAETSIDDAAAGEFKIAIAAAGATDTQLRLTESRVALKRLEDTSLVTGSAYSLDKDVFHYAWPASETVVTLYFHLLDRSPRRTSRVAIPRDLGSVLPKFDYNLIGRAHRSDLVDLFKTHLQD